MPVLGSGWRGREPEGGGGGDGKRDSEFASAWSFSGRASCPITSGSSACGPSACPPVAHALELGGCGALPLPESRGLAVEVVAVRPIIEIQFAFVELAQRPAPSLFCGQLFGNGWWLS
jgi:hypothetical protein